MTTAGMIRIRQIVAQPLVVAGSVDADATGFNYGCAGLIGVPTSREANIGR